MTSPVRTEKLSKTYEVRARKGLFKSEHRSVEALKSITLEVNQGEVFGLLGPNGAGKTTLIKILTTLLLPTSGSAWINGFSVTQDENKVRGSVGCMLMGERGLYWKLTGRENLEYFGALYHLDPAARKKIQSDYRYAQAGRDCRPYGGILLFRSEDEPRFWQGADQRRTAAGVG